MASNKVERAWRAAETAKPSTWQIMGMRCTSTGLGPEQRSDRWVAEACGPEGECLEAEADSPEDALQSLTAQLRAVTRETS